MAAPRTRAIAPNTYSIEAVPYALAEPRDDTHQQPDTVNPLRGSIERAAPAQSKRGGAREILIDRPRLVAAVKRPGKSEAASCRPDRPPLTSQEILLSARSASFRNKQPPAVRAADGNSRRLSFQKASSQPHGDCFSHRIPAYEPTSGARTGPRLLPFAHSHSPQQRGHDPNAKCHKAGQRVHDKLVC